MTREQLKAKFPHASQAFLDANSDMGSVEADSPKQTALPPLDRKLPKRGVRSKRVEVRVTLIACRHRLVDPDAVAFSFKPLTDDIAETLGVDDADPRVRWSWHQQQTQGAEGTIVLIERL